MAIAINVMAMVMARGSECFASARWRQTGFIGDTQVQSMKQDTPFLDGSLAEHGRLDTGDGGKWRGPGLGVVYVAAPSGPSISWKADRER
ncbi:hypothetical protein VSR34_15295 [Paraburkholderia sp. JHI2823]|uniref:hypothetical protein n=1 Tax=Paraburkholderia TaxID=1822464 RepID=UPI00316F6A78